MAKEKHNQMDKVKKCYRFWLKKKVHKVKILPNKKEK